MESSGVVRTIAGRFQVSTKVIAATKNDKGAFVQAMDFKLKNVGDNLRKDLNFMLQSDGSGALAKVTANPTTSVLTVDNALAVRINMVLNAWSARTGGTQRVGGGANNTVLNVDYDANTVTISGSWSDALVNDFLFKAMGRSINVMGLLGLVDDSTFVATLQNINRSSFAFWKASIIANGGVNRALTQVLLQTSEDKPYIKAGGKISAFFSNLGQRQNYVQIVVADRRYVNTMKFDAGYEALEYNGKPWFVDRDAVKNTIFALDESVLRFFLLKDIGWMDEDGSVLFRTSGLGYEATLEGHMEFGTYQPNRHAVIRDLSEPANY